MGNKRVVSLALLLSLVAFGSSACSLLPVEEEAPAAPVVRSYEKTEYTTVAVKRGDVQEYKVVGCSYSSAKQIDLSFGVSGIALGAVYVAQGDSVKEGQLLAELDRTSVLAQIDAKHEEISAMENARKEDTEYYELDLQAAKLTLESLQSDYESADDAAKSALAAKVEAQKGRIQTLKDNYDRQAKIYDLRLDLLNMELNDLKAEDARRTIYSGMDGIIKTVASADEGYTSEAGVTFITVMDESVSVFSVKGDSSKYFSIGDNVEISVGKSAYSATVTSPEALGIVGEESVIYMVLDEFSDFSQGTSGSISVVTGGVSDVLYLPTSAIKTYNGTPAVYYLDEGGNKQIKNVETGYEADGFVEIVSGVSEGDTIIIS